MKNSNNKILTVAVVLLLVTNIALVFFLMNNKGKGNEKRTGAKGDPSEVMAKELNMTEQQKNEHKQLKDDHFKAMKPFYDSLRTAKAAFYALTKEADVNDSTLAVYSQRIYDRQAEIDKYTFAHFKRVRNLLTAEQQPKFDEFLQKMMQRGRKDSASKGK